MRLIDYKEELLEEKRLAAELSEFLFTKRKFIGLNVLECDMEKLISMVIQTHQSILDYMEELSQPQGIDKDRLIEELESIASRYPYKVVGQPETYGEYNMAWQDCIDVVEQAIEKTQPTSDGWIPCSERLPSKEEYSEDGFVLVQTGGDIIYKGFYEAESGFWVDEMGFKFTYMPIAWQSLPQPYKENNDVF